MRFRTFFALGPVLGAFLAGCAGFNQPIPQNPQPGYPCGIDGLVCEAEVRPGVFKPTGACCIEGDVCGGGAWSGCPAGSCCYEGSDERRLKVHAPTRMPDASYGPNS